MTTSSSLQHKIGSQKSPAWCFIVPLFLLSTLFWMAAATLVPVLFVVLESWPSIVVPIVWGCIIALPVCNAFGPILAPERYLRNQLNVEIVTDDPAYASLVSEVNAMARQAGLKYIRYVGIERDQFNAFAFGLSTRQSAVVLGSRLLKGLGRDQIRAIIGHEIGHLISGDTKLSTMLMVCELTYRNGIITPISAVAGFFGITFMAAGASTPVYDRESATSSAILKLIAVFFLLVSGSVWLFGVVTVFLIEIVKSYHSRRREHRADVVGGLLTSRQHMISALAALEKATIGELPPDPFASLKVINHAQKTSSRFFGLLNTHPTVKARIQYLESFQGWGD